MAKLTLFHGSPEIIEKPQRTKDINKATGDNLISLARTLGCGVEDLLEAEE